MDLKTAASIVYAGAPGNLEDTMFTPLPTAEVIHLRVQNKQRELARISRAIAEKEQKHVCEHGQLRRSCLICEQAAEITELKMQLGFQALNQETIIRQASEMRKQAAEIAQLKRGEFICRSCGLRKDSETEVAHEF